MRGSGGTVNGNRRRCDAAGPGGVAYWVKAGDLGRATLGGRPWAGDEGRVEGRATNGGESRGGATQGGFMAGTGAGGKIPAAGPADNYTRLPRRGACADLSVDTAIKSTRGNSVEFACRLVRRRGRQLDKCCRRPRACRVSRKRPASPHPRQPTRPPLHVASPRSPASRPVLRRPSFVARLRSPVLCRPPQVARPLSPASGRPPLVARLIAFSRSVRRTRPTRRACGRRGRIRSPR